MSTRERDKQEWMRDEQVGTFSKIILLPVATSEITLLIVLRPKQIKTTTSNTATAV